MSVREPCRLSSVDNSGTVGSVEIGRSTLASPAKVTMPSRSAGLFADGGDVWQRGRAAPDDHKASALWLNGLKWTPGVGVRVATPVGPFQVNVGYNPFARPAGAIYYDVPPDANGFAPLYCVSPNNTIPAILGPRGYEQVAGNACPATFQPQQSRTFFSRLTWTFSIGPDF